MANRYILFQAYGNPQILAECRLALIQLLQHNDPKKICIVLYTDNPGYFSTELKVFETNIIEQLTPALITKWRGVIDFVHRVKIEILLDFFSKYRGSVLYCDTDTCCKISVSEIFQQVEMGAIYMHANEGLISNGTNPVLKKWNKFLTDNPVKIKEYAISSVNEITMWNAGVIGMHSNWSQLLQQVLDLTDSIYPLFPKHTVEQFAFSYIFQKSNPILPADDFIFHYWDLKEYRIFLTEFFEMNNTLSLPELMKKIQPFLPQVILKDKMAYKKLPFLQKLVQKKWSIAKYQGFL